MSEENIVMSIAEIENNTNSEVFGLSSPIEEEQVVIEPTPEPIVEPTPEPEPEPIVEPTPEPAVIEPISEPEPVVIKPIPEPKPEPVVIEPISEPVVIEPTPEPKPVVIEPTPEPKPVVIEPTPEPEPVVIEPTPEPKTEPIVEPTPEPEPVVIEPTPEPIVEPTPEPEPVIMRHRIEFSSGKICDQEDYSTGFTFEDSDIRNIERDELEDSDMTFEDSDMTFEDSDMTFEDSDIPELVFIVPYRDREEHYKIFSSHMKNILEGKKYKIYYVHQCDNQEFNRGAMKNIGFLIVKQLYPDFYKDITLIFNDIDTMPYIKDLFEYNTKIGNVKHFYGFTYTLGGIVSIKASDFEKINGFPNFWSWGYEDNILLQRVNNGNLIIDRSQFYEKGDNNILQLNDGLFRNINRAEFDFFMRQTTEGIHSIYDLEYKIDEITGFINVNKFNTDRKENKDTRSMHDLRNGNVPFAHIMVNKKKPKRMGMVMM